MDDRIKWLNGHIDEYLRILNEMDRQESEDEIFEEQKPEEVKKGKKWHYEKRKVVKLNFKNSDKLLDIKGNLDI